MQNTILVWIHCVLFSYSSHFSFGQLIEETCSKDHSIIHVNGNVAIDSVAGISLNAKECMWLLKPEHGKYFAEIETTDLDSDPTGELELYEYDDINTCPVFGTECQNPFTHEQVRYIDGACVEDENRKFDWCKVNRTEYDNNDGRDYTLRICEPCFSDVSSIDLVGFSTICYNNCDNVGPDTYNSCTDNVNFKLPAVIKYKKEGKHKSFILKITFKPCSEGTTAKVERTSLVTISSADKRSITSSTHQNSENFTTATIPKKHKVGNTINTTLILSIGLPIVVFMLLILVILILKRRKVLKSNARNVVPHEKTISGHIEGDPVIVDNIIYGSHNSESNEKHMVDNILYGTRK